MQPAPHEVRAGGGESSHLLKASLHALASVSAVLRSEGLLHQALQQRILRLVVVAHLCVSGGVAWTRGDAGPAWLCDEQFFCFCLK